MPPGFTLLMSNSAVTPFTVSATASNACRLSTACRSSTATTAIHVQRRRLLKLIFPDSCNNLCAPGFRSKGRCAPDIAQSAGHEHRLTSSDKCALCNELIPRCRHQRQGRCFDQTKPSRNFCQTFRLDRTKLSIGVVGHSKDAVANRKPQLLWVRN